MHTERRLFARIPFQGQASLQLAAAASDWPVTLVDLSFKGALIDLPPDTAAGSVTPGDTGTLLLQLGRQPEECIAMLVDVAHVDGLHAGLQCRGIDLDSVTHLRRLLSVNMGDAALLDRELKALCR